MFSGATYCNGSSMTSGWGVRFWRNSCGSSSSWCPPKPSRPGPLTVFLLRYPYRHSPSKTSRTFPPMFPPSFGQTLYNPFLFPTFSTLSPSSTRLRRRPVFPSSLPLDGSLSLRPFFEGLSGPVPSFDLEGGRESTVVKAADRLPFFRREWSRDS